MADRSVTLRLRAVITEYQAAMKRAAGDTAAMSKSAQGSFTELNRKVGQLGSELTRKVTVPLVGTGVGALKLATDFETAFSQMVGLAGVAGDEVGHLREEILGLSHETGVGPQQLAQALYEASSAGLTTAQALDAVRMAAKASAAGMGDASEIVGLIASATAAYGGDVVNATQAVDALTAAVKLGRANPRELAGSLGAVLPIAAQLGVTFQETLGSVANLSNVFGDASRTTNSLRAMFANMLTPSEQGRETLEKMAGSADALKNAIDRNGLLGALEVLRTSGIAGSDEALRSLFSDIDGYTAAVSLLNDKTGALAPTLDAVAHSAGVAKDAFDQARSTEGFKVKQGVVDVQIALIQLGELLGPFAAVFGTTIGGIATAFGQLPVPIQQVVVSLLAVAAAAGPLMKVFGSLAGPAVSAIKMIVGGLRTLRAEIIASQMAGASYGQALASSLAPAALGFGAVAVAVTGAAIILNDYNKKKQRASELSQQLAIDLNNEADAANKLSAISLGKDLLAGSLGESLREAQAFVPILVDSVRNGSAVLDQALGDLSIGISEVEKNLLTAAKAGDPLAQELLRIGRSGKLTSAEFVELIRLLGSQSTTFGTNSREAANNAYVQGQVGDKAKEAGVAIESSTSATADQARAWDIANQSAAGLTQGVANLLGMLGALFGATFDVGNAEQGFADSVSDVDGAMRTGGGSTRDYAKEQRSLEGATKDVTKAQKDLADAEAALVEARKGPSAREKSDAALDVREATLAVKEATKAQSDARMKLLEERKKGKEGDVAGAQLDVERSAISLKRAQDRLTDAQKNQNTVLHSGEEQSQDVKTALDDLEQAQDRVADATQRQIEAEATLRGDGAGGGPVADRARTLRGAYDNLATSGQNWITKLIESGAPTSEVVTALRTQRDAVQQVIDKYGDANGKLEAYLGWLTAIERQVRLMDPNDPSSVGQGGADYSGVSLNKDGYPIRADGSNLFGGRASGGLVAPFETYEMGEAGPEALTVGTTRPPDKLGKGRAAAELSGRSATGARTFMVGLDGPQLITMGAEPGWVTPNNKLGDVDGARAAGGPVRARGTYLVGEDGPEVLTVGGFESTQRMLERRTATDRSDTAQRLVEKASLRERFTERVRSVLQAIRERESSKESESTATTDASSATERASVTDTSASESTTSVAETVRAETASDSSTSTAITDRTVTSERTADKELVESERASDRTSSATSATDRTTSDSTSSDSTASTERTTAVNRTADRERFDSERADSVLRDATTLMSESFESASQSDVTSAESQTVRDRQRTSESSDRSSDTQRTVESQTAAPLPTLPATPFYMRLNNTIQQAARELGLPPIDLGLGQTSQGADTVPYRMTERGPVFLVPSGPLGAPGAPGRYGGAGARSVSSSQSSTMVVYDVGVDGPEVITMGSLPGWVTARGEMIEGRANGGPVAANKTYLVGEDGPEILTVGGMVTSRHSATNDTSERNRLVERSASSSVSSLSTTSERSADVRSSATTRESDRERLAPALDERRAEQFAGFSPQGAATATAVPWSGHLASAASVPAPQAPIEITINNRTDLDGHALANSLIRISKQAGGLPISITKPY